ncbi:MAG: hypothetical protein AMXMBFR34_36290 [Myxococcaceae bacterium]
MNSAVISLRHAASNVTAFSAPPSDAQVTAVLHRVLRRAKQDWADVDEAWPEDEYEALQAHALQRPLDLELPASSRRTRRVALAHGFSLHVDTAVHGNDRQGLERLCRYGARGPIAECRLTRLDDGRYQYTPKKGLTFTLTAEGPRPSPGGLGASPPAHLTTFHGVYAPHAALRPIVTQPPPASPAVPSPPITTASTPPKRPTRHLDWASAPSAPTSSTAPVAGAAPSAASTPPAPRPRGASPSWVSPPAAHPPAAPARLVGVRAAAVPRRGWAGRRRRRAGAGRLGLEATLAALRNRRSLLSRLGPLP